MGPSLDEEIKQFIPKTLYHYTSKEGLLGILKDKRLWCTSVFYLNDSTEFNYARRLIMDELDRRLSTQPAKEDLTLFDSPEKDEKHLLQSTKSLMENTKTDDVFVFSLSRKKDDLNQWRVYCPKGGGGVSIGFDRDKLYTLEQKLTSVAPGKLDLCQLQICLYKRNEQLELINGFLDDQLRRTKEIDDPDARKRELGKLPGTLALLLSLYVAPSMKDPKFSEEEEIRLVFKPHEPDLKFRSGTSMVVPYLEFPLTDGDEPLDIIKEIWVGPTPHMNLSVKSIESLMKKQGINCEVFASEVPFISW